MTDIDSVPARRRIAGDVPAPRERRSVCPVACTLDIVGDRWTLVIVRDLFLGKTRFGEFLASPEHVPTNILAERLRRLQRARLVEASPYSEHPRRFEYRLAPAGQALLPVIEAITDWGLTHIHGTARMLRPAPGSSP